MVQSQGNIVHTQRALLSAKCRKERERRRDCREKEEIGKERNSRQAVCICAGGGHRRIQLSTGEKYM